VHLAIKILVWALALWAVYVLSGVAQAYLEFKERPREPMGWCHRHGFFRKKHLLPFMSTTVCPRCYMEAWNNAEKGELGKKL
jgi:hypothetical protein